MQPRLILNLAQAQLMVVARGLVALCDQGAEHDVEYPVRKIEVVHAPDFEKFSSEHSVVRGFFLGEGNCTAFYVIGNIGVIPFSTHYLLVSEPNEVGWAHTLIATVQRNIFGDNPTERKIISIAQSRLTRRTSIFPLRPKFSEIIVMSEVPEGGSIRF